MSQFLYLDIETVGVSDPAIVAEIAASIKPPSNYSKAETIADWETNTKPGLVQSAVEKTALDGALGKVVCIGWAWNDEPVVALTTTDEGDLFAASLMSIQETRPQGFNRPVIVGHNVAGFDIRYLWQRAFVLGVKMPAWFPRDPKPWSENVHDTMGMWAGARDYISLDNLCRALGIPGKGEVSGADVGRLWREGMYETIAEYCRSDVERVRFIHRRMLLAMGEAPPKQTAA
jgi:hypothetical protein